MPDEFKFQKGDIVEYGGVRGVVVVVYNPFSESMSVKFENGITCGFFINGKQCNWEKVPVLKLIERPKKKRKVEKTVWINKYNAGLLEGLCEGDSNFINMTGSESEWMDTHIPVRIEFEVDE